MAFQGRQLKENNATIFWQNSCKFVVVSCKWSPGQYFLLFPMAFPGSFTIAYFSIHPRSLSLKLKSILIESPRQVFRKIWVPIWKAVGKIDLKINWWIILSLSWKWKWTHCILVVGKGECESESVSWKVKVNSPYLGCGERRGWKWECKWGPPLLQALAAKEWEMGIYKK